MSIFTIPENYDYTKSTEANYADEDAEFNGEFQYLRQMLDYSYHSHYCAERQLFHDGLVQQFHDAIIFDGDDVCDRPLNNWIVFTAGAMGAGKSHTLNWLFDHDLFPLWSFVRVDPDSLRELLPETPEYVRRDPSSAGYFTQKEVGYISEVLTLEALRDGKNVLVDGSLRDAKWYSQYFRHLRTNFPRLKIGIIHVTASTSTIMRRVKHRAVATGRLVPEEVICNTLLQLPVSLQRLTPLADMVCTFENEDDAKGPALVSSSWGDLSMERFKAHWEMTCSPCHIIFPPPQMQSISDVKTMHKNGVKPFQFKINDNGKCTIGDGVYYPAHSFSENDADDA